MKQNLNETGLTWELTFEANPLPIKLYQCKAIPENLHNVKQNPKSLQCSLGEPSIKIFSKSWDFVPTGYTLPPNIGIPKKGRKKCLFWILGYSKHIIFSWKSPFFWVKRVGTGTPPSPLIWILSQVYPKFDRLFLAHFLGGPINYWIDEILPPHLCTMCFITFMDSSKAN